VQEPSSKSIKFAIFTLTHDTKA